MSKNITKSLLKNVAYCATFALLSGCALTSLNVAEDLLAPSTVLLQSQTINSTKSAQLMEQFALEQQALADASLLNIEAICQPKFLVFKCINDAKQARNERWDAAQINLTAARLYLRTQEANQTKVELLNKVAAHEAAEKLNAPNRAANAKAFQAKYNAYVKRQADYAAQQAAQAPERAASAAAFNERVSAVEAIKAKRVADNAKRVAEAEAKRLAEE